MTTRALVLADRDGSDIEPLAGGVLPALLRVGGKAVIQHCIEDLWEAGIRDVAVAVPGADRTIERELGDGRRFGLTLRYIDVGGLPAPAEALSAANLPAEDPLVVARGDVLRGRCARLLVSIAHHAAPDIVHGVVGSRPAGIALLSRRTRGVNRLDWPTVRDGHRSDKASIVELGDVGFTALDGMSGLFEACLGAIEGRYRGLMLDGRERDRPGQWLGPRVSISRSVHLGGLARIGRGAHLHRDVELAGRVDIGDRCVIDDGAQLIDTAVMPGTYVGRGVRLQNAIAWGPWLYRADLGTCQRVDDPLLLSGPGSAEAA
ncbi:MAG: hypothetical protein U1F08_02565 [Steroidobacteraceae bacterium]